MLLACPLAGLSRWEHTMRGESSRAMRADAVPNAASTPRHTKNHTLLADPAGRVSCIPAPPHVRSPGRKRPDRARVTAAGRGPSNGNNDIELPSTSISHLLLLFGRGIFWRDGFRPIISCQRPPPPPSRAWARFSRADRGLLSIPYRSTSCVATMPYSSDRIRPQTVTEKGRGPLGLLDGACMGA
jgi:hypothetical protein